MSVLLCVQYAERPLLGNTIASDTRVFTPEKRSLYVKAISRLEVSGDVVEDLPVPML
jgi:hypothetical protein